MDPSADKAVTEASDGAAPRPLDEIGLFGRALLRKTVFVLVFAAVAYGSYLFYTDLPELLQSFARIDPGVALAAVALCSGNFVIRYFRWEFYLRRLGFSLPMAESALVFLAGFSMTLTPMKAGEVLKSVMLQQSHDLPISKTGPIVVAERITDLGGLVLLTAYGCLGFPNGKLLAAMGALGVFALMLLCAWPPVGELVLRMMTKVRLFERFSAKLRKAFTTLWTLTGPLPFLVGLALSIVAWGLQCYSLQLVAGSFPEVALSLEASTFIYAAPLLAGIIAMLPGGLGLTEASMTGLIVRLGGAFVTSGVAAVITLVVRFAALWWGMGVGVLALLAWQLRRRRLVSSRA